jgi:hypothetical protein
LAGTQGVKVAPKYKMRKEVKNLDLEGKYLYI